MRFTRLLHLPIPGIRIQLTLWYTAIFAFLILLFSVFFYTTLQTSLASEVDSALSLQAQQIAAGISFENGAIAIQDVTGELTGLHTATANDPGNGQIGPDHGTTPSDVNIGTLVRILAATGQVVYVSPAFRSLNVPAASITRSLQGTSWQGTVLAKNGQAVRLYSVALTDNGHAYGVLQVGESLAQSSATSQNILIALLIVTPIVLLLSAFGNYWLAKRAFRPIDRLTQAARDIKAGDLHRRVPIPGSRDEVHALAVTLNEMIARLEQAFVQQRRFVADASHELRTPVAVIRSVTDVALEHKLTRKEYVAALHDINAESERLSKLITELLSLARADEGQLAIDHEPVRLDLLAQDVVASIEPLAIECEINLKLGQTEPATVSGDTLRLIQVMMALVDNALTYTNAGGCISLSVAVRNKQAYFAVRDTGIGIAPEDVSHLFERFFRADPARSRAAGGSGLGLSIADWIVRAHGGSVTVESQIGQGSTFTVILPLAPTTQAFRDEQAKAVGTALHQR